MVDGGTSTSGNDTCGVVNPVYNVLGSSGADPQGSRPTPVARTSRCFDGITHQELGSKDNRALDSDDNQLAEDEKHLIEQAQRFGGKKKQISPRCMRGGICWFSVKESAWPKLHLQRVLCWLEGFMDGTIPLCG